MQGENLTPDPAAPGKRALRSWALYDWANSAFTTLILTFVYGAYFSQSVAPDPLRGAELWGYAVSASGFLMLFLGPVCGVLADRSGRLKKWIFGSSLLCLAGTLCLAFGVPSASPGLIFFLLCGLVLANTGFELAIVFYNALLPRVAKPGQLGRASSFAWGLGYAGGLISLLITLFFFIGVGGIGPFIELPRAEAWHVRAVVPFTVIWFASFSWPLFVFVPDVSTKAPVLANLLRETLSGLSRSWRSIRADKAWRHFLIGSAVYRDGLNTLFAVGGIYAAQKFSLEMSSVLLFGIGMNVTAGLGAFAVSFFEDKIGSFRIVRFSLAGLFLSCLAVLFSTQVEWFFFSALTLGLFVGPVQSASRTLVARLSPAHALAEHYGLYALTGRAASFLGPLCYALATGFFADQSAGMATILVFWLAGYIWIARLKDA